MRRSELQAALQDAITLAQSGQRTEARRLLEQVVELDPGQAVAWMWLATVSSNREERIAFLERALTIDPANATAQEAYTQLTGRIFSPVSAAGTAPGEPPRNRVALVRGGLILITMLVLVIAAAFVLAGQIIGDNGDKPPLPTLRAVTAQPNVPRRTQPAQQQPGLPNLLPTRTWTPLPTRTPGPSPTSIWNAPPPTWTQAATTTPVPTRTPAPSLTPYPTAEAVMGSYARSATARFVLTSDAGPATVEAVRTQAAITPTRTLTFDRQTATARFEQTRDAATARAVEDEAKPTPIPGDVTPEGE
jgi:hypothetical protein